jgi:type IV secretion system protein VirB11
LAFEQMAIMIQDSPGGANLTFEVIKRLLTLMIDVVIQFQNVGGERFISEIYFDPEKKLRATL